MGKLHHWQFYLRELEGPDNAPLKYDDRLQGMYLYKLHKTPTAETKIVGIPAESIRQKSTAAQLAQQLAYDICGCVRWEKLIFNLYFQSTEAWYYTNSNFPVF